MPPTLPFVSPIKPRNPWPQPTRRRPIGPADIVVFDGDNVRVCHVETANGPLCDGPQPLSLCYDPGRGRANRLVDGVRVSQVGGVVMLRVE